MPELLSPAGNFEKLKAAVLYGADAVYCAGQMFGMRAAADNFSVEELYEAAALDGATRFKMMLFITLPQIGYMISIQLLLSISGSLLAFDTPYIMTDGSGGPNGAATTVVFGIYTKAYTELQYGQAMATSIILLIVMLAMTLVKQAFEKKFGDD